MHSKQWRHRKWKLGTGAETPPAPGPIYMRKLVWSLGLFFHVYYWFHPDFSFRPQFEITLFFHFDSVLTETSLKIEDWVFVLMISNIRACDKSLNNMRKMLWITRDLAKGQRFLVWHWNQCSVLFRNLVMCCLIFFLFFIKKTYYATVCFQVGN